MEQPGAWRPAMPPINRLPEGQSTGLPCPAKDAGSKRSPSWRISLARLRAGYHVLFPPPMHWLLWIEDWPDIIEPVTHSANFDHNLEIVVNLTVDYSTVSELVCKNRQVDPRHRIIAQNNNRTSRRSSPERDFGFDCHIGADQSSSIDYQSILAHWDASRRCCKAGQGHSDGRLF